MKLVHQWVTDVLDAAHVAEDNIYLATNPGAEQIAIRNYGTHIHQIRVVRRIWGFSLLDEPEHLLMELPEIRAVAIWLPEYWLAGNFVCETHHFIVETKKMYILYWKDYYNDIGVPLPISLISKARAFEEGVL